MLEKDVARKPNLFIQAGQQMDVYQLRILYQMLAQLKSSEEDDMFEIDIHSIIQSDSPDVLKRLDSATNDLMRQILVIDHEGIRHKYNVVSYCRFVHQGAGNPNVLWAKFSRDVVPILEAMTKSGYTKIMLEYITRIRSAHSVRMYELLRRWKDQDESWVVKVDDLRFMLGCEEKYPIYADFKKNVILKAQTDCELYTDISFTFEQIKRGPKIKSLVFTISENTPKAAPIIQETLPLKIPKKAPSMPEGITDRHKDIVRHFLKSDPESQKTILQDVEPLRILWAENYVKNSIDVKNPGALFRWCCLDKKADNRYAEAIQQREAAKAANKAIEQKHHSAEGSQSEELATPEEISSVLSAIFKGAFK